MGTVGCHSKLLASFVPGVASSQVGSMIAVWGKEAEAVTLTISGMVARNLKAVVASVPKRYGRCIGKLVLSSSTYLI